jgi:hypothetical protein
MAKPNRGTLPGGKRYQQIRDPAGEHYQATSAVELNNLLSSGYSLPDGVDFTEAAEYLSANVRRGDVPAATAAASSSGGGAPAGATGGAATSGTSGSGAGGGGGAGGSS